MSKNDTETTHPAWVEFDRLGFHYRTNHDASVVEGRDGSRWTRTGSLAVRESAQAALRAAAGAS